MKDEKVVGTDGESVKSPSILTIEARTRKQRERSLEDVIKQLDFQPVNRLIITCPLIQSEVQSETKLVLSKGSMPHTTGLDAKKFTRVIYAVSEDLSERWGISPGDKVLAFDGGIEFIMNGIAVNAFKEHEIFGVSKSKK